MIDYPKMETVFVLFLFSMMANSYCETESILGTGTVWTTEGAALEQC